MGDSKVPVLDLPRVQSEEVGFELRDVKFTFRPAGAPDEYAKMNNSDTDEELLVHADAFIRPTLNNDCVDDWDDLRSPDAQVPLWFDEIIAVARHIASVTAARPTMPSSGSSATQPASGTASTADSSSPVAVPSAA